MSCVTWNVLFFDESGSKRLRGEKIVRYTKGEKRKNKLQCLIEVFDPGHAVVLSLEPWIATVGGLFYKGEVVVQAFSLGPNSIEE